jgi:DNA-binding transcriptional ArsR family regulator
MHNTIGEFAMPPDEDVAEAVDMLRMLGDATRLKILLALHQGESSVACLAELAGTTPTAVSQHLAKLRLVGAVKARKEGTFVFYTVAPGRMLDLLDTLFETKASVVSAR